MLIVASIIVAGCNKPDEPNNGGNNNGGVNDGSDGTVMVATLEPNDITATTALCHAEITLSGGLTFKELGVCWSTHENPTINDAHLFTDTPGAGAFTCTITNLEPNTAYHVRAYALLDTVCYYGKDKTFTTEEDPGNYDGHDYVDLGLPSGTLWATCNVGANSPEEYGDYFAWGETEPKSDYNWSSYKWCNGEYKQLTKYCNNAYFGSNGYTDTLTILQPVDDAATANWGENWRMPTKQECEELCLHTTSTWTTLNGINGYLLTASNNNSLFMPASGEWQAEGQEASYLGFGITSWASTLYTEDPNGAWAFGGNGDIGTGVIVGSAHDEFNRRNLGFTIRPIYSAK